MASCKFTCGAANNRTVLYDGVAVHCVCIIMLGLCIHLPVEHLGWFHTLTVMNSAAVNTGIQASFRHTGFLLLAGSYSSSSSRFFEETPYCFHCYELPFSQILTSICFCPFVSNHSDMKQYFVVGLSLIPDDFMYLSVICMSFETCLSVFVKFLN